MFDDVGYDVLDVFIWPDVLSDQVELVCNEISAFVWGEHSRPCHCVA